jgi:hypothetical protein
VTTRAETRLYVGPGEAAGWDNLSDPLGDLPGGPYDLVYASIGRLRRRQLLRALRRYRLAMRPRALLVVVALDCAEVGRILGLPGTAFEDQALLARLLDEEQVHVTAELLVPYLTLAGFGNPRRTIELALFDDVSRRSCAGCRLGLVVLADAI